MGFEQAEHDRKDILGCQTNLYRRIQWDLEANDYSDSNMAKSVARKQCGKVSDDRKVTLGFL